MIYESQPLRRMAPLLILIPIVCFWVFLLTYASNIPWMDDIESFLYFQLGYLRAETLSAKIEWLLKPNNEHRILFAKLVSTAMYTLTGQVDFRWLILIASLWIAGILLVFYRVFRTIQAPLIAFLPVTLLLLHPQYYLISLSAVTSFQHQTAVCLVFLAVYLLAKPGAGRFTGALAAQVLVSFSMSNGLFGWIAGTATLLVQRRFKEAAVWLGIGVVTIYFYLHGFASPQGNETSVSYFLSHPHLVFLAFFTFSGALVDFFPDAPILLRSILPTLMGFALIGTFLWLLKRMLLPWPQASVNPEPKAVRRNFLIGAYGFLMVNAVIIAFLRPRFGYFVMLISNYTLYSSLLAILLYLNILSEFRNAQVRQRWITVGVSLGLVVWSMLYFRNWTRVAERKQNFETFAFNQKVDGIGLGATLGTPFAGLARQWMDSAVAMKIYQYPATFYTPDEPILREPATEKTTTLIPISITEQPDAYWVQTEGWSVPDGIANACIIAKSAEHTYLFPVTTLFLPKPFFLGRKVPRLGAQVLKSMLYPGRYQLGILLAPGSDRAVQYLDRWITVK